MKRFKRRLSQTLRGSHTIDESLSELAEQMTIEENGLKDSGTFILCQPGPQIRGGEITIPLPVLWRLAPNDPGWRHASRLYGLRDVEMEGEGHHLLSQLISTDSAGNASGCPPQSTVAMVPWIWKLSGVSMTLPQQLGRPVESSQAS